MKATGFIKLFSDLMIGFVVLNMKMNSVWDANEEGTSVWPGHISEKFPAWHCECRISCNRRVTWSGGFSCLLLQIKFSDCLNQIWPEYEMVIKLWRWTTFKIFYLFNNGWVEPLPPFRPILIFRQSEALFILPLFHVNTEQNSSIWPCVHIAPLWKRSLSETLMKRINLKTLRFEHDPFSLWTPRTETFENGSHSFAERLFITMAFKLATRAFLTTANKGVFMKKGLATPFR